MIVTLDTVRADHLGCYGYFRDTTPILDRFARGALRFARCLAPVAHTTPSHASLFTGIHPLEHGVLANSFVVLLQAAADGSERAALPARTLAQALAERGLSTGGFVSGMPLKRACGLSTGFGSWTEPGPGQSRRPGREAVADAIGFIDSAPDRPFFAWVHLFEAHGPVEPPGWPPAKYLDAFAADERLASWLRERGVERGPALDEALRAHDEYDALLRYLDDTLAPLLERLDREDLRERTAVVVAGDHGEGLGQHGMLGHGEAWNEQLHVPLLMRVPGREPAVIDALASTIDVIPTLLGLAPGLRDDELLARGRGVDLLAAGPGARAVFGMAPGGRGARCVTSEEWKLIRFEDGRIELFDLESDPHELRDVSAAHPAVAAALERALDEEISGQSERCRLGGDRAGRAAPDEAATIRTLRALGYLAEEGMIGDPEPKQRRPRSP